MLAEHVQLRHQIQGTAASSDDAAVMDEVTGRTSLEAHAQVLVEDMNQTLNGINMTVK